MPRRRHTIFIELERDRSESFLSTGRPVTIKATESAAVITALPQMYTAPSASHLANPPLAPTLKIVSDARPFETAPTRIAPGWRMGACHAIA